MPNTSALGWDNGLCRSSPCLPQTTEDDQMGSWMARLGLSKLKPMEMKPIRCRYNKPQQRRTSDRSLGQELPWEGVTAEPR